MKPSFPSLISKMMTISEYSRLIEVLQGNYFWATKANWVISFCWKLGGTAQQRGSVGTSHPAVLSSNLATSEISVEILSAVLWRTKAYLSKWRVTNRTPRKNVRKFLNNILVESIVHEGITWVGVPEAFYFAASIMPTHNTLLFYFSKLTTTLGDNLLKV